MKATKKILSLVMAVLLLSSCLSIGAFADNTSGVRQYGAEGGYLAIGDSFTRGNGASASWSAEVDEYDTIRSLTGSYVRQVAEAVGCSTTEKFEVVEGSYVKGDLWNISSPGLTLAAIFDIFGIDDGYYDDEFIHEYRDGNYGYFVDTRYAPLVEVYGDETSTQAKNNTAYGKVGKVGSARDLAADAQLITVASGMCDVFWRAVYVSAASGMSDLGEFAKTLITNMYKGYSYWEKNYPVLLAELRKLNPTADIVMVGATDMLFNAFISEEVMIPVGTALSVITDLMNSKYEEWASEKDGIYYADISNVDCGAEQYDWTLLEDIGTDKYDEMTHPTPEGYAYIARQILNALPGKNTKERATDIVVDLGRFDSVSYVNVDGKTVSNYTIDGTVLTVPYLFKNAELLTVGVYRDRQEKANNHGNTGKTLSIVVYKLEFKNNEYVADKLYVLNDTQSAINGIVKTTKTVVSKLSDMFTKKN